MFHFQYGLKFHSALIDIDTHDSIPMKPAEISEVISSSQNGVTQQDHDEMIRLLQRKEDMLRVESILNVDWQVAFVQVLQQNNWHSYVLIGFMAFICIFCIIVCACCFVGCKSHSGHFNKIKKEQLIKQDKRRKGQIHGRISLA